MAEAPIFSSQSSQYELHQILQEKENSSSSPLRSQRPKKPPTVTPKRFTKFFTPRASLQSRLQRQSRAGRQLKDITKNGANRRRNAQPLEYHKSNVTEIDEHTPRPLKRRKRSIDIASSPLQSSPLKRIQRSEDIEVFEDLPNSPVYSEGDALTDLLEDLRPFPQPLRRLRSSGHNHRIMQRSFGGYDALRRGRAAYDHCVDWRAETANFVSSPSDVHALSSSALPFCTTSCSTNSLVAIGEEEGGVRLVDSSASSDFATSHVAFRPHHNAIMDIAFSSDDYLLVTASGDQTARLVDMHTQQTICILSGHTSSVKQVRFQPSDDNMITTSSRDGSVMIWDMRCGGKGSVQSLRTSFARNVDTGNVEPPVRYAKHSLLHIGAAHRPLKVTNRRISSGQDLEPMGVSITSIQHLPNGWEHLLLTTSEINSSIKLWDLRHAGRRSYSALLSSTHIPESHSKTRNYGINSMTFSGDGARLYTACRDGIVYAYSTNHLVLGCAPELDASNTKPRMHKSPGTGIGPLYGFKHPSLRLATFYVKAAIRPAHGDKGEMLAVGSSDDCAVLFSTDERHLLKRELIAEPGDEQDEAGLPLVPASSNQRSTVDAQETGIPIYEQGTALTRGHNKEVTSLTWTYDGELVTLGDDFTARCWREDGDKARELRACGEGGGRRWGCGWADMDAAWDEEDG